MTGVFHGFVNVDDPIQDSAAPVAGPTDLRQQRVPARSQQRDADALLRRREFVGLVASLLVTAVLPLAAGCGSQGPRCSDDDLLTTPERTLRVSHEYTERSPYGPEKSCL
ncbi:MAG: hypothetical protein JRH19_26655, partial [Deltaproteobacteria bacterium]|nr:hypothetical protein [Deltaproteobacteria bacterium]